MTSVNDIFRSFGPEYLERYANSMPKTHLKVIDAMIAAPKPAALRSTNAHPALGPMNSIAPAVIATARLANNIRPNSG